MDLRKDALAGAAEFILAVETIGRSMTGLSATVGAVTVSPNAPNVISGAVELSLDVRHAYDSLRQQAVDTLMSQARGIAAERDLVWQIVSEAHEMAVPMDGSLQFLLSQAMEAAGHLPYSLVSGAGHDAVVMARMTPSAMLFLRSPGGLSHHPDERVIPEDAVAALEVMRRFLLLTAEEYEQNSQKGYTPQ